jgi:hypothetical protein
MSMRNITFLPWHGGIHSSSVYPAYVAQRLRARRIKVERVLLPEFVSELYHNNLRVIVAAMPWEVEYTDEFDEWFDGLGEEAQEDVALAVEKLEERGPGLPRPLADTVDGSRHSNMKELRPLGTNIRVLFAFDPRRMAILLIGGDKTDRWSEFYEEMIPVADDLYDEHLDELREEGQIP